MNSITLENTLAALRQRQHVIDVPEDIAERARRAVERMLAVG
jgi:quinolinate synthase